MMETMEIKAIRGMNDILPEEAERWQYVEDTSRKVFESYGYRQLRMPLLEETRLFTRSVGETTEIVRKQMYSFMDRKGRSLTLRPEATASVVRAYLEANLDKKSSFWKLYYIGPMFRSERPQKGRSRQFHQLGAEVIGSANPHLDAEVISLLANIISSVGLAGYEIRLNSIGCQKDRDAYSKILRLKLKDKIKAMCPDCQYRYEANIFRLLDCKREGCRKIIFGLPSILDSLCKDCSAHFDAVKKALDSLKIAYAIYPYLVRGLDYYTKTAFEVTHPALGGQDALGGGGRYDTLIEDFGGSPTPALGFAIGLERLLLACSQSSVDFPVSAGVDLYLVTMGQSAYEQAYQLLETLRSNGIKSEIDYEGKPLKSQMKTANKLKARYVAILGDEELKKNVVTLKDMIEGKQWQVGGDNFVEEMKELLK